MQPTVTLKAASKVMRCLDICNLLEKKVNDINFELNYHFGTDEPHLTYLKSKLNDYTLFRYLSEKNINYLIAVLSGKKEPSRFVKLRESILCCCDNCGTPVRFLFDGKTLKIEDECPFKGDISYEFELNVPSGKMLVANDLRRDFPIVGDYYVNHAIGCKNTSLKYAEAGMAHAMVGNTCPSVYRLKEDKFTIGNKANGGRKVASVCTDLWWYSIVDYDEFNKRQCKETKFDVVKCKPGVYRFKHLFHNVNRDKRAVFTEVDWVREPDPVKNYSAEYDNLNLTAGQVVKASLKSNYFTHDMDDKKLPILDSIQRIVDHVICVGGNGYEYHKNGFLSSSPDLKNDAPSVKIPVFNKAYKWYPLSQYSFIVRASSDEEKPDWLDGIAPKDLKLNDSFVSLVFNVLHCILKYGIKEGYSKEHTAETIKYAKQAMAGFVNKYPTQIPDYVKSYLAKNSL